MNEELTQVDPVRANDEHAADEGDPLEGDLIRPVAAELRRLYLVAPSSTLEGQHLARMRSALESDRTAAVVPLGSARRRRGVVAGAIVAATIAGSIGLAAAGVLPSPLQNAAAAALRPLGLQLHTIESDSQPDGPGEPAGTSVPSSAGDAGRSDDAPGRGGENPGQSSDSPGQATDPGRSQDAPGHGGENPGQSTDAPGHAGETPGQSADAPGKSADAPGQSGDHSGTGGVPSSVGPPSTKPPVVPPSTARPTPPMSATPPTKVTPPTTERVPPTTKPVERPAKP